jgi:TorA maturation chaperone TorD/Pyruvate/2-oxoacid:ferredoxin oxidoreductase delta subunit
VNQAGLLSKIYAGLADVLAEAGLGKPPEWLALSGPEWPLFTPLKALATRYENPQLSQAAAVMTAVATGPRRAACEQLFAGHGRPSILLYESWHVDGRFPTPTTFAVQAQYRQAGLELSGELPDHAAVELEFLSFLAGREEEDADQAQKWRAARRRFLKEHAGRWLPEVGRRLSAADNPAWSAVGLLLMAVLVPRKRPPLHQPIPDRIKSHLLPSVDNVGDCTFCTFCAQVCPTHALRVVEDDQTTRLQLLVHGCIHCGKCERVCDEKALVMGEKETWTSVISLCESPRAHCPLCGRPTVSQAEIDAISRRLGSHPVWLDYCLDCRAHP